MAQSHTNICSQTLRRSGPGAVVAGTVSVKQFRTCAACEMQSKHLSRSFIHFQQIYTNFIDFLPFSLREFSDGFK